MAEPRIVGYIEPIWVPGRGDNTNSVPEASSCAESGEGAQEPCLLSPFFTMHDDTVGVSMKPITEIPNRAEQVYLSIRDSISEGMLSPGTHLVQEHLVAELGVSRQPVQ